MALTQKQKEAVNLMITVPYISNGDVAKELHVDASTVYRWKQKQEFLDYWDEQLAIAWKDSIRMAQRKMHELAANGDRYAAQYILDSGGFAKTNKVELDGSLSINIDIADDEE